jgi:hypothetical protein
MAIKKTTARAAAPQAARLLLARFCQREEQGCLPCMRVRSRTRQDPRHHKSTKNSLKKWIFGLAGAERGETPLSQNEVLSESTFGFIT